MNNTKGSTLEPKKWKQERKSKGTKIKYYQQKINIKKMELDSTVLVIILNVNRPDPLI